MDEKIKELIELFNESYYNEQGVEYNTRNVAIMTRSSNLIELNYNEYKFKYNGYFTALYLEDSIESRSNFRITIDGKNLELFEVYDGKIIINVNYL